MLVFETFNVNPSSCKHVTNVSTIRTSWLANVANTAVAKVQPAILPVFTPFAQCELTHSRKTWGTARIFVARRFQYPSATRNFFFEILSHRWSALVLANANSTNLTCRNLMFTCINLCLQPSHLHQLYRLCLHGWFQECCEFCGCLDLLWKAIYMCHPLFIQFLFPASNF